MAITMKAKIRSVKLAPFCVEHAKANIFAHLASNNTFANWWTGLALVWMAPLTQGRLSVNDASILALLAKTYPLNVEVAILT